MSKTNNEKRKNQRRRVRTKSSAAEDSSLDVRVLALENYREAEKLSQLLELSYGNDAALTEIFSPDFWCTTLEQNSQRYLNLVNLVIRLEGKLVGHIALNIRPSSSSVDLIFPAFHPDYQDNVVTLGSALWRQIKRVADRQQWKHMFLLGYHAHSTWKLLAEDCFRTHVATVLPVLPQKNDEPNAEFPGQQKCMLINYNPISESSSAPVPLFPPPSHQEKIVHLYRPFHLQRSFNDSLDSHAVRTKDEISEYAVFDVDHELGNPFMDQLKVRHLGVIPGNISDPDGAVNYLCQKEARMNNEGHQLAVHVALDDPECVSFCSILEESGYRFCGVLPEIKGRDFITYAKTGIAEVATITPPRQQSTQKAIQAVSY